MEFFVGVTIVINMSWSNEQFSFAVEIYFRKIVISVQYSVRCISAIKSPQNAVPYRKSMLLWVTQIHDRSLHSEKYDGFVYDHNSGGTISSNTSIFLIPLILNSM